MRFFIRPFLPTLPMNRLFFASLYCCCWLLSTSVVAQTPRYRISGTIKEADSGETLIGATVYNLYDSTGTTTNTDGYFTLATRRDSALLQISYVGYSPQLLPLRLTKNHTLDIALETAIAIGGVVVESNSNAQLLKDPQMSVEEITAKQAKEIAALMGEADIVKLLQLKPGVQASIEGSSGLFVRGGSSDQNLFLLDGAPLYNPSHLLGLFSTFNADAVKNVQLYKGSFPTRFGGRLSSVLDVQMREGDRKTFRLSGGIGLIAARLLAEGPLAKNNGSFLISGRSSYAHPFPKSTQSGQSR